MIEIQAKITGDGYTGSPNFKVSLWLSNMSDNVVVVTHISYELYAGTKSDGQFLGFGEAYKQGSDDCETELVYMCPRCTGIGVASIFELSEQKIGLIEVSRAQKDATFMLNVFLDARVRDLDNEDDQELNYKRLIVKVDTTVPVAEWKQWRDSWTEKRVLMVNRDTVGMLDKLLSERNAGDYDVLIKELLNVSVPPVTQKTDEERVKEESDS